MSNPQAQNKTYLLKIIKGQDKGVQFKLVNNRIRIGRDLDNDIVLNDPKCSRKHAVITISDNTLLIEDLNSSGGVEVDGIKAPKAFLQPGCIILIGSTQLKFEENAPKSPSLMALKNLADNQIKDFNKKPGVHQPKPNNRLFFYIIILAVAGLLGWLLLSEDNPSQAPQLLSDEDVDESIENSKRRQDEIIKAQNLSGKNSRQYLEAQSTFLKGLRDYREGHYKRAAQSFSATLAIFPQHELAQRYYQLAQKKHDELVQYSFNEAIKFMEQEKYKEALAAFQNVMILINDANNKTYQEAKEKYQEVKLLLNEVY